jgi:IS1 family transposase
MSSSSSSASPLCRAQAIRQYAIVAGQEDRPIPFSALLFAAKSRRYLAELVVGSGSSDIVIDSVFDRDSVIRFICACQGGDFSVTKSNVSEIELLCDEWEVVGKSIRKKISELIERENLHLTRLLFRLSRGLAASEAENLLRRNLIDFVSDTAALEIPAAVLVRIIDFSEYSGRSDEYGRLSRFCVEYLRAHGSASSQIMRTVDVTGLSDDDLFRLLSLKDFNWGVLNVSVCRFLIAVRADLARERDRNRALGEQNVSQGREMIDLRRAIGQQHKEMGDLRKEIAREAREKGDLIAMNKAQRREMERTEEERNQLEGTIAGQSSKIESLKAANEKSTDALKCSIEANSGLKRELEALKEAMKTRQELPVPPKPGKQFPPSVKQGCQFEVPDGIIGHLTRECGGNVHDHNIIEVTSYIPSGADRIWVTGSHRSNPARNAAALADGSIFQSAPFNGHSYDQNTPHTRNNWLCYDFKDRRIVPTHYAIRSHQHGDSGAEHLKSWLVETSADSQTWKEVDRREGSTELNGQSLTRTFAVTGGSACRFIRLVNIGRTHHGDDCVAISALEIFGSLIQ